MMNKINSEKLPIKYALGVFTSLPNFPTIEDILFEVCSDRQIIEGKEFDYKYVKHLSNFKLDEEKFNEFLNFYVENGIINKVKDKFRLVKNIWQ